MTEETVSHVGHGRSALTRCHFTGLCLYEIIILLLDLLILHVPADYLEISESTETLLMKMSSTVLLTSLQSWQGREQEAWKNTDSSDP